MSDFRIESLKSDDVDDFLSLLKVFGRAFEDESTYQKKLPNQAYLRDFLAKTHHFVLVAKKESEILGGLVAYELEKFEQARNEIYIYDLAVAEEYRRKGIAKALIEKLKSLGRSRGAWVIYVQADLEDDPAIKLYQSLGTKESVLHFDFLL